LAGHALKVGTIVKPYRPDAHTCQRGIGDAGRGFSFWLSSPSLASPPLEKCLQYLDEQTGLAWAVCFYLKAKCGWRDWPDPAGVSVNIGVADEERQAAEDRQRALFKLATPEEIAMYRRFLQRLLIRQQQQANRGAVETTAEPVASNGAKPEDTE
jgi:hypothetical protein